MHYSLILSNFHFRNLKCELTFTPFYETKMNTCQQCIAVQIIINEMKSWSLYPILFWILIWILCQLSWATPLIGKIPFIGKKKTKPQLFHRIPMTQNTEKSNENIFLRTKHKTFNAFENRKGEKNGVFSKLFLFRCSGVLSWHHFISVFHLTIFKWKTRKLSFFRL